MAFKMKGSPMARNYGAPFNNNGKEDAKAVRRAKGTEDQEVGNLLNILNEAGSGGTIDNYTKYANRDADYDYYADKVKSRPGWEDTIGTNLDQAVESARKSDEQQAAEGANKSPRDVIVQSTADDYFSKNRTQAEEDAIKSVEARDMAQADAVNEMVKREAARRTEKNVEGAAAQARIDVKAAEDAEEARYNALSRSEQRREDRAKAKSAVPKSGFKMHRKGNFGK